MHVHCLLFDDMFLLETDPCASNPCRNNATCSAVNGNGYQCICTPDTTGINCENRKHLASSFLQQAYPWMQRKTNTRWPIYKLHNVFRLGDPCAVNPCLNNGQCIGNSYGGFSCSCIQPYTGQRCEDRIDPCANQPCRNGATCYPSNTNSYQCLCAPGYTGVDCSTRKSCMLLR